MKKEDKVIASARVLFISILDKIYLIILGISFLVGTISIFKGPIGNLNYGFFWRISREIIFLVILFIVYLFMNWFYKCAEKTVLCLTKNKVYKEHYIPFKKSKTILPINKITGVSTITFFWIFRCIIIHQYNKLPLIFFTWDNEDFKNHLEELITNEKDNINMDLKTHNIITKEMIKIIKYIGIVFATLICLLGIVRFFAYMFNIERKMAGIYKSDSYQVELKKNGSCMLNGFVNDLKSCSWSYKKDTSEINISYEYSYNYGYYKGISNDSFNMKYNKDEKILEYRNMKFVR